MQYPGVDVYSKSLHGTRVDSILGTKLVNSSFWGDTVPEVKVPNTPQHGVDDEEGAYHSIFVFHSVDMYFICRTFSNSSTVF